MRPSGHPEPKIFTINLIKSLKRKGKKLHEAVLQISSTIRRRLQVKFYKSSRGECCSIFTYVLYSHVFSFKDISVDEI